MKKHTAFIFTAEQIIVVRQLHPLTKSMNVTVIQTF